VVGVGVLTCVGALAAIGVTGPDGLLPPVWGVPLGELAVLALGLALLWWGGDGARPLDPPGP
jgi:lipopolysaccharide export LptBFGC system permease protein LptF